MRFEDILRLFKSYAILGSLTLLMACAIFLLIYFIIYKRLMKGPKRLSFWRVSSYGLLFCYIFIIIGATLLSRGTWYIDSRIDFLPLNQYRSAWFTFSIIEWRNIILNIAMFVPLGFMLPLFFKRLRTIWKTIIICFIGTVFIETTQLITGRGIFALDDILHNTLGALIGYGLFCFILTIMKSRPLQIRRLIFSLIPTLVTVMFFISIFVAYELKEFGNMPVTYVNTLNMKNIILTNEAELSDEPAQAVVYATSGVSSAKQARVFADDFFSSLQAVLDETYMQLYNGTAFYYAHTSTGQTLSLVINYRAMTYTYTDFSSFDHNKDKANEDEIRSALETFGISIPEKTIFSENDNGVYRFEAYPASNGSMVYWGSLECDYYDDGTIKRINNNLVECHPVKTTGIISEQTAYERIREGMFRHYAPHQINSLHIISVELIYDMDTKGFLQPVYKFKAEIDGHEQVIIIPALGKNHIKVAK